MTNIRDNKGQFLAGHNQPGPGRPPLYPDPDEFADAVNQYFENLPEGKPPTVAGLCLALGFHNKDSFADQAKRGDAFSRTIEAARLRIEAYLEESLYQKGRSHQGIQFALSANFGWNPKSVVEHDGQPPINRIELVAPEGFEAVEVETNDLPEEKSKFSGLTIIAQTE